MAFVSKFDCSCSEKICNCCLSWPGDGEAQGVKVFISVSSDAEVKTALEVIAGSKG